MPVRSLNSPVLRWPDAKTVETALRRWVEKAVQGRRDVLRIGYFGSYARGGWGVGSDLDMIIILESSELPFESRLTGWSVTGLPVPADMIVYTEEEWQSLRKGRFYQTVMQEAVWVYLRGVADRDVS